ncbi:hypothetical protein HYPSUDRAFT_56071 [Hypholoma sublateritium FD-334 SS-4]|uniref:Uncharacterized protein n=1 Tax=Hypholoma sublateritium (strain FD-334 SS-4) TaxID=945553 RepID=A0A0D2L195_HYPSF|nr:hypothetical protein HYPSUDRAFT_56071 [Hypholoma sublateritium FD-334 SS-4]
MPFSLGGRHAPRVNLPVYNVEDGDSDMHSMSDEESTSQSDDESASDYDSSQTFQAVGIVETGESYQGHVAQEKESQPLPNNATGHFVRETHSQCGRVRANDSGRQIAPKILTKDSGHLFYLGVDASYIVRHKALSEFPDSEAILLLIPSTNVGGWAHGHASSSQFYWKPDIQAMVRKLAMFDHQKHMRAAGAQANLDEFKQKRYALVAEISCHAIQCKSWAADLASHRAEETEEQTEARKQAIRDKFIALGYAENDIISALSSQREYYGKAGLTDRIWKRIQPILEPFIQTTQTKRKAYEFSKICEERKQIVRDLYKEFKGSLQPREWKYLPHAPEIVGLNPFSILIEAPPETKITRESFRDAMKMLPKLLSDAQDALKATLADLITSQLEAGEVSCPNSLDLAKSVFKCQKHTNPVPHELYVVGVDMILSHHCSQVFQWGYRDLSKPDEPAPDLPFCVDPSAIAVAEFLIKCAGLNPETALASDMDASDLRFNCSTGSCQSKHYGYSWRAAIAHGSGEHAAISILNQKWTVLSTEEADCIKGKEAADHKWRTLNWICAHCSMGLQGGKSQEEARFHVRDEHQIAEPTAPLDFFYFEQCIAPFKNPGAINYRSVRAAVVQTNSKDFKCIHCPGSRLFDSNGVIAHVKAKHRIDVPRNGVDWTKIAI